MPAQAISAPKGPTPAERPSFFLRLNERRGETAHVSDLMSESPHTCQMGDSCATVARRMRELNVGFLPVLEGKSVVGVVTDRDIALRHVGAPESGGAHTDVSGCMTPKVISVRPNDSVKEAVQTMRENQVRRLVVSERGELRGVLTLNDVFLQARLSDSLDNAVRETLGPQPVAKSR